MPNEKPDFHVVVLCVGDDDSPKNLVKSYVKRELRALGDVTLISRDLAIARADTVYFISIIVLELRNKAGVKTGVFAMSYCFYERFEFLKDMKLTALNEGDRAGLRILGNKYCYSEPSDYLQVGGTKEHLETCCKGLVADFDVKQLEPIRELLQRQRHISR